MRRLSICLLTFACSGGSPDDDSDPQAAPPTVDDTDVGVPAGIPRSASVSGTRFFSAGGGTTVGSFEPCDGPVTAWVDTDTVSLDLTCTFEDDEACTGTVRDQPLAGPWSLDWACEGIVGTAQITVAVAPPAALQAETTFDWPLDAGGLYYVGLQLTEP